MELVNNFMPEKDSLTLINYRCFLEAQNEDASNYDDHGEADTNQTISAVSSILLVIPRHDEIEHQEKENSAANGHGKEKDNQTRCGEVGTTFHKFTMECQGSKIQTSLGSSHE